MSCKTRRVTKGVAVFSHMREAVLAAERAAQSGMVDDVLGELRSLSLDEFSTVLLNLPDPELPGISRLLPRMAADEVQRSWTGNAGYPLLQQSLNFIRSVALQCVQLSGRPLSGRSVLDFGCGYGRLLRLMYYYNPPSQIWGVDPWTRSIELCREAGMLGNFAVSDYLPRDLPVKDARFGLIYAFSVFTHLSERATKQALSTLRRYVEDDGLCVITIRPKEYWDVVAQAGEGVDAERMKRLHDEVGFAFTPHNVAPVEGEITYGDTSLTRVWLGENVPEWKIAGYDRSLDDPLQIIVYLRPA